MKQEEVTNQILAQLDERLIRLLSVEQVVPSVQELIRADATISTAEAVVIDAVVSRLRPFMKRGLGEMRKGLLEEFRKVTEAMVSHVHAIEGLRYELHALRQVWPQVIEEAKKTEELN